ncbi:MAG: ribonuclease HII [Candidatus Aenigmarchaeota archaeon]|nr:ribonuclease HII [Candidatus Aenigmarchaeota archaeon]
MTEITIVAGEKKRKGPVVCGVDEAGRGAVVGPLVIAGVSVFEKDIAKLKKIGVRDSKELSPSQREKLAKEIEKIAKDIVVLKVGPCKIDDYNKQGVNLNRMEAMKMCTIIDCLNANKSYVDGPEVNTEKFKRVMQKMLKFGTELVVENHADSTYAVVSAASIMAKVERDKEMAELTKRYGIEGTGYPSDERTIKSMKEFLAKNKKFPEKGLVRYSWDTTKQMLGENKQKKLFGFLNR